MKHFERVLSAINHEEPDRVPIDLGGFHSSITLSAYEKLLNYMHLDLSPKIYDEVQGIVEPDLEIMERFGSDFIHIQPYGAKKSKKKYLSHNLYIDEFGIKWTKPPSSYYFDMIEHPLENMDVNEIENLKLPDADELLSVDGLAEVVKNCYDNTDYAITADPRLPGLFEFGWWLRGFEQFCVDLIVNREFVEILLDKIVNLYKDIYTKYLDGISDYFHIIEIGGDYGMQEGLVMSEKIFRELFKPRMEEYIRFIKKMAKNAKIQFHSCGSIISIIGDLIDAGVDILNPVQVSARDMNPVELKKKFGQEICFLGAIDTQEVLPHGTAKEVIDEVKRIIGILAPGGGYILSSVHNIQPEVPPENIVAMFETASEYGKYPIKGL